MGEFHFTALRTLGTLRAMSASRRFPTSRFQPGIAAMYACTGASPSAFAICGLPPERRTTPSRAPGLAFAPVFDDDLDLAAGLRGLLARDVRLALGFALAGIRTGVYAVCLYHACRTSRPGQRSVRWRRG